MQLRHGADRRRHARSGRRGPRRRRQDAEQDKTEEHREEHVEVPEHQPDRERKHERRHRDGHKRDDVRRDTRSVSGGKRPRDETETGDCGGRPQGKHHRRRNRGEHGHHLRDDRRVGVEEPLRDRGGAGEHRRFVRGLAVRDVASRLEQELEIEAGLSRVRRVELDRQPRETGPADDGEHDDETGGPLAHRGGSGGAAGPDGRVAGGSRSAATRLES